ncbi:hypothetical protein [Micromonospora avicenniae]|uniref:hypothetical protein n=1 Tax=Micromonospora avicenniae TaxID=1198245 RepID=UPI003318AA7A
MSTGLAEFFNVLGLLAAAVCFAPVFRSIVVQQVLRRSDPKDRHSVQNGVTVLFWTGLSLLLASVAWQAVKVMLLFLSAAVEA